MSFTGMLIRRNYNKVRYNKARYQIKKAPAVRRERKKARYQQGRDCSISFTFITIVNYYTNKTK
jgi:hypothetical protein